MRDVSDQQLYVRVWFGDTAVAHYRAPADLAHRYVAAVRGHFQGLRFTVDPLPQNAPARPLPAEVLWRLAP